MNKYNDEFPLFTCIQCKTPFTDAERAAQCADLDKQIKAFHERQKERKALRKNKKSA